MTKELSYVILEPHNMRMNRQMWEKKSNGTTKCEKKNVTCDVGTAQCEDGIVKCEKKSKGTTNCEKRIVTCDVRIA